MDQENIGRILFNKIMPAITRAVADAINEAAAEIVGGMLGN